MEALGVLMLSGILPVLIWLIVGVLLVKIVIRPTGSARRRWLIKLTAFAALMVLPFADKIAGSMYLNYLCENKVYVKIYKTVELSARYWDANSNPIFIASNGFVDMGLLPDNYEWRNVDEPYIDFFISIVKLHWQLVDLDTEVILGERITYLRRFGWLNRFSTAPNVGEGCKYIGDIEDAKKDQAFFNEIFIPRNNLFIKEK